MKWAGPSYNIRSKSVEGEWQVWILHTVLKLLATPPPPPPPPPLPSTAPMASVHHPLPSFTEYALSNTTPPLPRPPLQFDEGASSCKSVRSAASLCRALAELQCSQWPNNVPPLPPLPPKVCVCVWTLAQHSHSRGCWPLEDAGAKNTVNLRV